MNVEKIYGARKEFLDACEFCDKLEQDGLWPLAEQISMSECLRMEVANYCIYLTATDSVIRNVESIFFRVVLGLELTSEDIAEIVKENGLDSPEFATRVPAVISEIKGVREDRKAHDAGAQIADLFSSLGHCLISCDSEVTDDEKKQVNAYIDVLEGFLGDS